MEITEQRILSLPVGIVNDFIDVYKRTRDGKVDYVVRSRKDYCTLASLPRKQDAINDATKVAVFDLVCEAYHASQAPPNRSLIARPLIEMLEEWEHQVR